MIAEYTLASLLGLLIVLILDRASGLRVSSTREYLPALGLALFAQLVSDNLLVWRGFWAFNDAMNSGVRLPYLPVENLLFGTALFTATLLAWAWFSKGSRKRA